MNEDRLEFRDVILALLENALTEAQGGHASTISIELGADRVAVGDDGRGLPVHAHPQSGRPLLEVILTGPRRGPRNTLARLNSACLWVEAEVLREGQRFTQRFEYAEPATGLEAHGPASGQGTTIRCAPGVGDPPSFEDMRDYLHTLAEDGLEHEIRLRLRDTRVDQEATIVIEATG